MGSMRTLLRVGIVTAFAASALAQSTGDSVREAVREALREEGIASLGVSVENGTVVLQGRARNVFQKNKAVEIALEQEGVETVETDIEIAEAESSQQLGDQVVRELRRYSRFTVFDDVAAYVKEGKVVLVGWVTEPYKKTEMEKRLYDLIGIREFENQIEVLPTSMSDDRLRRTLANRLYRDPTFSDFASMAIPPIHIIVKHSRVILTGVVNNNLMKQKAVMLIRGTPGVLSVEDRIRIGS